MKYLRIAVLFIALLTVVSGAVQMISPDFVLNFIGGDIGKANAHSFGIIGMFMVLFGGLVVHTIYEASTSPTILLWAGLQKIGAAFAVALAIQKGLFIWIAALVAGFDLISGVVFFVYMNSMKTKP